MTRGLDPLRRPYFDDVYRTTFDDRVFEMLRGWLAKVRYKPDTTFELTRGPWNMQGPHVLVRRRLADSRLKTPTMAGYTLELYTTERLFVDISGYFPVTAEACIGEEAFVLWLRKQLIFMETHELDEWLQVDGKLPFDPHAGEVTVPR